MIHFPFIRPWVSSQVVLLRRVDDSLSLSPSSHPAAGLDEGKLAAASVGELRVSNLSTRQLEGDVRCYRTHSIDFCR